jgi:hypothetical protein
MAIARLTETQGAVNATAGNYDVAISAPASTPNGVCVIIVALATGANTDVVTSVTYGTAAGAVPLTERRWVPMTTEPSSVYLYWAGGVTYPSGAQTVRIVRTGTVSLRAVVCPMTVAAGQQVAVDNDTSLAQPTATSNPSWAMATTAAPTECYLGIASGLQTMVNTPATNWTLIGVHEDQGSQGRGWARRTMASAGAAAPGWTAGTAEDFVGASIAFKEAPLTSTATRGKPARRPRQGVPPHRGRAVYL